MADDKFKMATSKPEVLTTQAVSKIETRFRRLYHVFEDAQKNVTLIDNEMGTRGTEFSMATSEPEVLTSPF